MLTDVMNMPCIQNCVVKFIQELCGAELFLTSWKLNKRSGNCPCLCVELKLITVFARVRLWCRPRGSWIQHTNAHPISSIRLQQHPFFSEVVSSLRVFRINCINLTFHPRILYVLPMLLSLWSSEWAYVLSFPNVLTDWQTTIQPTNHPDNREEMNATDTTVRSSEIFCVFMLTPPTWTVNIDECLRNEPWCS